MFVYSECDTDCFESLRPIQTQTICCTSCSSTVNQLFEEWVSTGALTNVFSCCHYCKTFTLFAKLQRVHVLQLIIVWTSSLRVYQADWLIWEIQIRSWNVLICNVFWEEKTSQSRVENPHMALNPGHIGGTLITTVSTQLSFCKQKLH